MYCLKSLLENLIYILNEKQRTIQKILYTTWKCLTFGGKTHWSTIDKFQWNYCNNASKKLTIYQIFNMFYAYGWSPVY